MDADFLPRPSLPREQYFPRGFSTEVHLKKSLRPGGICFNSSTDFAHENFDQLWATLQIHVQVNFLMLTTVGICLLVLRPNYVVIQTCPVDLHSAERSCLLFHENGSKLNLDVQNVKCLENNFWRATPGINSLPKTPPMIFSRKLSFTRKITSSETRHQASSSPARQTSPSYPPWPSCLATTDPAHSWSPNSRPLAARACCPSPAP